MEKNEFYKMLDDNQYKELEEKLKEEYDANRKLETKYQLGVCYGEQFDKIENAKKIFKELMSTDFRPPYIYSFNAKHSKGDTEKIKIINEGLRIYPDNSMLNNQLLFYLEDVEKEQHYKKIDDMDILQDSSILNMISYYFEKEDYANAVKIFKNNEVKIRNANFNTKDIELIRNLSLYLNNEKVDLDEISSLIISDNNSINETILRLVEIDVVSNKNIIKAKKLLQQVNYRSKYPEDFIELVNFSDYTSSCFTMKKILFNIIDKLEIKFDDEEDKRKLKLIKSLHNLYWEEDNIKKVN